MNRLFLLFCLIAPMLFTGCLTIVKPADSVALIEINSDKHLLSVVIWRWGRDGSGLIGYKAWTYWAKLAGDGPLYKNPGFEGSGSWPSVGTITLDKKIIR